MLPVGYELAAGGLIGLGVFCTVHAAALFAYGRSPSGTEPGRGIELGLTLVLSGLSGLLAGAGRDSDAAGGEKVGLALTYAALFFFWPILTANQRLPLRWLAAAGLPVTFFAPPLWQERFAALMLAVGLVGWASGVRLAWRMPGGGLFAAAGALLLFSPLLATAWPAISKHWTETVAWVGGLVLGVAQAVTTAARQAGTLRDIRRLEEKTRAFLKTLSDLVHELRTPLASIRGYLEALNDGIARHPRRRQRYVRRSLSRLSELERLVGNLLEWAKLTEIRTPPRTTLLDTRRLLRDALYRFENDAKLRRIVLRLAGNPADPPLPVEADADQIRRVLDNLLSNALRFTPAGGTVTLEAEETDGCAVLKVSDTGPGIPSADMPHIFERYYTSGTAGAGVGLGLAVAKEIVERHGGRLGVEPNVPHGAVFVVSLPLHRA